MHLELAFVQDGRCGHYFILLHVDIQFFQNHLLRVLSFLQCVFLVSLSIIQMTVVCVYLCWGFLFSLIDLYAYFCASSILFYYFGSVICFELWNGNCSSIFVIALVFFCFCQGLLWLSGVFL